MEKYKLLKDQLKILKLDAINENFYSKAEEYRKNGLDYIEYLSDLLSTQINKNIERSINYRLRVAKFPFIKTVEQFDFNFQPCVDKNKYYELLNFDFISKAENIILLGPPGVGKTHLAIGIGIKACEKRIRVLFTQFNELIEQLRIAKISKSLPVIIDSLSRYTLFIIDEVGYMPISNDDSNLFFQLISRKYEKTSIIITSNKIFKDWGTIFNDDVIASAIIDRLAHHSYIFKITGNSYRIKNKLVENIKSKL